MKIAVGYPKITTKNDKYNYTCIMIYTADGGYHPKGWYGRICLSSTLANAEKTMAYWAGRHTDRGLADFVIVELK